MSDYRDDHKAMMDSLLGAMPGVKVSKAFGYPAYSVNGKVFAFVGGSGVAIKLGRVRVAELAAHGGAMKVFEVADGMFWKDWLSIDRDHSGDYEQDVPLFEESLEYVLNK